jgi:hypothetical protein
MLLAVIAARAISATPWSPFDVVEVVMPSMIPSPPPQV